MLSVKSFKQTYFTLMPLLRQIIDKVKAEPIENRPGTAHINRLGAITQYAYYVSLVRYFINDTNAIILDWGGQHGQVTKLMSHFFKNTACYVLKDDPYYNAYDLKYWHSKLSVKNVIFGTDSARINLPDYSVDVVLSSGVLEHVREGGTTEKQALHGINRILKQDGMLFIWNLPYKYGSGEMLYQLLKRKHHDRRYVRKEIITLLDTDFEIIYFDHHGLMTVKMLNVVARIIGHDNAFIFDYYISKLPIVNLIAQHFTIVARKKKIYRHNKKTYY